MRCGVLPGVVHGGMVMNYLRQLAKLPRLEGIRTAVIMDGPCQGHRMLYTDRMLILDCTPKDSPLTGWLPVLSIVPESCTLSLAGQHVFVEVLGVPPELVLCGQGEVPLLLIPMAKRLGFQVVLVTDSQKDGEEARQAGADQVVCQDLPQALRQRSGGGNTYFAVLTRELYEQRCLEELLPKEWAYVGVMGGRERLELVRRRLAQKGIDQRRIDRMHGPIGLDIGARTPEELALAILAEIVSVYRKGQQAGSYPNQLLEAAGEEPCVLATVVEVKRDVPWSVGTKLLVSQKGQTGTLGGGALEQQVLARARELLAGREDAALVRLADAEGDAGQVSVLLERMA